MAANSKSHAISQTAYTGANGNFHVICNVKGLTSNSSKIRKEEEAAQGFSQINGHRRCDRINLKDTGIRNKIYKCHALEEIEKVDQ